MTIKFQMHWTLFLALLYNKIVAAGDQGALLLTWININPSMDK